MICNLYDNQLKKATFARKIYKYIGMILNSNTYYYTCNKFKKWYNIFAYISSSNFAIKIHNLHKYIILQINIKYIYIYIYIYIYWEALNKRVRNVASLSGARAIYMSVFTTINPLFTTGHYPSSVYTS